MSMPLASHPLQLPPPPSPPPPFPPKDTPKVRTTSSSDLFRSKCSHRHTVEAVEDNNSPRSSHSNEKHSSNWGDKEKRVSVVIDHWPTEPYRLKESVSLISVLYTVVDFVIVILPVFFFVLCILAAKLNKVPIERSSLGKKVEAATKIGPTLFPMLFAAVAGRTTKMIARFMAERGAKLGTLELLVASQTVWGTFESQLLLRRLSVVGAHLLILWALSPLGGQASLRLLDSGISAIVTNGTLKYLDTGAPSFPASEFQTSDTLSSALDQVYVASLLAPSKTMSGPQDTWGNVKVPRLEMLSNPDQAGWMDVPTLSSADNFTSLVGIPVVGPAQGFTSFTFEASYLNVECHTQQVYPMEPGNASASWKQYLGQIYSNSSTPFLDHLLDTASEFQQKFTTFFLDTKLSCRDVPRLMAFAGKPLTPLQLQDPILNDTRSIVFGSRIPDVNSISRLMISQCDIFSTHVEALTECTDNTKCAVTKMRRSLIDKRSPVLTPLDAWPLAGLFFMRLPWVAGVQHSGLSTPTEIFIKNTSISPYHVTAQDEYNYVDLSEINLQALSIRLALVLNTYYQTSLASLAFAGDLPQDEASYPSYMYANYSGPFIAGTTIGTSTVSSQIYVTNYLWLALLAVCASVLLAMGGVGLGLKYLSHAPDMLGYVASMTYHNPHVALPRGGGPLDGMERARVLKDVRVRIADVHGSSDVGHVALISIDDKVHRTDTGDIRPLEKKRSYL